MLWQSKQESKCITSECNNEITLYQTQIYTPHLHHPMHMPVRLCQGQTALYNLCVLIIVMIREFISFLCFYLTSCITTAVT